MSKSSVKISTWINTNYFLWLLCAGHAENGTDEDWTIAFETQYQSRWNEIQAKVQEVKGPYRFGLVIPPPPVFEAIVTHVRETDPANHCFKICVEDRPTHLAPPATSLPRDGVWGFWQFLSEREQFLPDEFDVVIETWSTSSSSPYSNSFVSSSLPSPALSVASLPSYSCLATPPPSYLESMADENVSPDGDISY